MAEAKGINDRYGLPMSTSSTQAAEHYVEGVDLVLSQGYGAEEEFRHAIEADEGLAIAHGALAMMLAMRLAIAEAKDRAAQAQALGEGLPRRERRLIEAVALWVNGQGPQATSIVTEQLKEFPRDALMLRLVQRLYNQGCSSSGAGVPDFPPRFYALLTSLAPEYGDDWAFQGPYAWANHEVGLMQEGLDLAQRSLEQRPDNATAAHSVAHVFFERGDPIGGSDFLCNWLESYDRRAAYRVHLSWHQALFDLALGRYGQAVSWYEDGIRPNVVAGKGESLADCASLMWRMQMYADTPPPLPCEEVRALAAPAAEKPGPAFRDAHAALAFASAGDESSLGRMIDGLRDAGEKGNDLAKEVTLPLVQGIGAFAKGDYRQAVRWMEPAYTQLVRIGGSHAQREVFEDTMLEAYLRAEEFDKAEGMLRVRLDNRPSIRDTFRLGRVQAGTGQKDEANINFQGAVDRWQDADSGSAELEHLNQAVERTR